MRALDEQIRLWEWRRTEGGRRGQVASVARAAIASAAFAASGGSLIAPFLACLGVLFAPPFEAPRRPAVQAADSGEAA